MPFKIWKQAYYSHNYNGISVAKEVHWFPFFFFFSFVFPCLFGILQRREFIVWKIKRKNENASFLLGKITQYVKRGHVLFGIDFGWKGYHFTVLFFSLYQTDTMIEKKIFQVNQRCIVHGTVGLLFFVAIFPLFLFKIATTQIDSVMRVFGQTN